LTYTNAQFLILNIVCIYSEFCATRYTTKNNYRNQWFVWDSKIGIKPNSY